MVIVHSIFKVANGMESEVRQAFLDRPHLVDDVEGFLGLEVLTSRDDASIFHLVTRWADEATFRSWHTGSLHKTAHRGIPKGLKLDASHTSLRVLDVLTAETDSGRASAPNPEMPAGIASSRLFHWLRASSDGAIVTANRAFELLFDEAPGTLAGLSLWERLTARDAGAVQAILKNGQANPEAPMLLNFVDRHQHVHTLECHLELEGSHFVMGGKPVAADNDALSQQLMDLNNRWSLLVRENEKNVKALRHANEKLERALMDLNQSHWHLRKIEETLPICMYCGKVETAEARWEGLLEYIQQNSLFLSHGCCPDCVDRMYSPKG